MLVPLRPPVDLAATLDRFSRYGADAANVLEPDGALVRTFPDAGGVPVACRLRQAPGGVEVESEPAADATVAAGVRRFLGDDWDLDLAHAVAARDPDLPSLPYVRPLRFAAPFEALVTAITAQQVSLHAATSIRSRVVERYGERIAFARAFPAPSALAVADPAELRALGLSLRKVEYVVDLARAVASGALDLGGLEARDDEVVIAEICARRGLGRWTAEWYLLRALGRPDALPAGDLGVRKSIAAVLGREAVSESEARERAERWRPVRGLVVLLCLSR